MVFVVHGEDEVKLLEVGFLEPTGGSGDGVVSVAQSLRHAGVGLFSGVHGNGAGGVTGDLLGETGLLNEVAENVVACR